MPKCDFSIVAFLVGCFWICLIFFLSLMHIASVIQQNLFVCVVIIQIEPTIISFIVQSIRSGRIQQNMKESK